MHILAILSLFGIMVLQVVIPPIPAELIVIAAGKEYGVLEATLVSGAGLWAGSMLVYYFGVRIRHWFQRFFRKEKVELVMEHLLHNQNFILWIRILPYNPSDVISYGAGILKIRPRKFLVITFLTSYIRCAALTFMGTRIRSVKHILIVLSLLAVSAILANALIAARKARK